MFRPQYTLEQIHAYSDELPGFNESADALEVLYDMQYMDNRWQPVLSATVVTRINNELHVLTGARGDEGNTTHVNVASTPTMRIPQQEARSLIVNTDDAVPFCLFGEVEPSAPFVSRSLEPGTADVPDNTDPLSSKVSHLLALKLGLGSALERAREPIGHASLARCVIGFSYLHDDSSGQALYEPLIMLGAVVGLEPEIAMQIPAQTDSYNRLGWARIDRYAKGVATKTLIEVMPNAQFSDELEVCVRGLCNATSSNIVSGYSDIQHHLTEGFGARSKSPSRRLFVDLD